MRGSGSRRSCGGWLARSGNWRDAFIHRQDINEDSNQHQNDADDESLVSVEGFQARTLVVVRIAVVVLMAAHTLRGADWLVGSALRRRSDKWDDV
jgi:hypothetical protein